MINQDEFDDRLASEISVYASFCKAQLKLGGEDRVDDLTAEYGWQLHLQLSLRDWKEYCKTLASFASDFRFRTYEDISDTEYIAFNTVALRLQEAGFRPKRGRTWKEFEVAASKIIAEKSPDIVRSLVACIRMHLNDPLGN